MSTCIRAGATFKRHVWRHGRCWHCGVSQYQEKFESDPTTAEELQEIAPTSQVAENSWDKHYEKHEQSEHDDFPSDFQDEELDRDI